MLNYHLLDCTINNRLLCALYYYLMLYNYLDIQDESFDVMLNIIRIRKIFIYDLQALYTVQSILVYI